MKLKKQFIAMLAAFCGIVVLWKAQAQESTNDATITFKQCLANYQSHPDDAALREKIIELVATMNPKPEIPEEARGHFIKAKALQQDAKDPSDYDLVIKEYTDAEMIAPWLPEVIYNKAMAREAQGEYQQAIDGMKLYLLTRPGGDEARSVQDKIYLLEARLEKEAKAKAEQQRQEQAAAARRAEAALAEQEQKDKLNAINAKYEGAVWDLPTSIFTDNIFFCSGREVYHRFVQRKGRYPNGVVAGDFQLECDLHVTVSELEDGEVEFYHDTTDPNIFIRTENDWPAFKLSLNSTTQVLTEIIYIKTQGWMAPVKISRK